MFRILVPDAQYADDAAVERAVAGPDFAFTVHRERERGRVPAADYAACDGVMAWHEVAIDRDLIGQLDRARIIVRCGVGFDHIDLAAAGAAGIPICNTPDYGTSEVADHAIALILALARGVVSYHAALAPDPVGGWDVHRAPLVRRLRGTRLGLVGLGRIGTATALRAKGFGFEILAYDPYLPRGQEIALGLRRVERLHDLMAESDIVSLHCPLTDETRGLIGAAALAAMPPHALLVNTARGAIVDIDALHAALVARQLAGAALDVLPQEPPDPAHPLIAGYREQADWARGRLLLTPHAAWWSPDSAHDARRLSAETLVAYLRDGSLRNCVNERFLTRRR